MRRKPNPEDWRVIDFTSIYAAGFVWERLEWLMDFDPYLTMFTKETRQGICSMVLTALGDGEGRIVANTDRKIHQSIYYHIEMTPLGLLGTHQFKMHLISLVQQAVLSGKEENGVLK